MSLKITPILVLEKWCKVYLFVREHVVPDTFTDVERLFICQNISCSDHDDTEDGEVKEIWHSIQNDKSSNTIKK